MGNIEFLNSDRIKITDILNFVKQNEYSAFFYTPKILKNGLTYLFKGEPLFCRSAFTQKDVAGLLNDIDCFTDKKFFGFTTLSYELFTDKKEHNLFPLLFASFYNADNVLRISNSQLDFSDVYDILMKKIKIVKSLEYSKNRKKYIRDIKKIKHLITEGETYQVNYTINSTFQMKEDPVLLFLIGIYNQSADYSCFINMKDFYILSFSPELFFKIENGIITALPMKGTAKRGINLPDDKKQVKLLKSSGKERAENVMIVDLLRNDIAKISKVNSIKAEKLFMVKKYETVFQMVSEVKGKLIENSLSAVIKSLFPCGSVTGAPKIRTMEIISSLEQRNRNIYTGSIGLLLPEKKIFNVAIRTVLLNKKNQKAEFGIGSGVTLGSNPEDEYREVLLKSRFLLNPAKPFYVFETMLVENGKVFLADAHFTRMKETSDFFNFVFSISKLKKTINEIIDKEKDKTQFRLKIMLDKWGDLKYQVSELKKTPEIVKVIASKKRTKKEDKFLYFKTTNRSLYDSEYKKYENEGYFDCLFFNKENFLTEGSISNIFYKINNKWFTPTYKQGLLSGCMRNEILKNNKEIIERDISISDLLMIESMFLTNSVRKITPVDEIYFPDSPPLQLKKIKKAELDSIFSE